LITGIGIFAFPRYDDQYIKNIDPDRFYGSETGQDRVALVEERVYSGISRIDLMERAQHSLDISYYTIQSDTSGDIFWGVVLSAAQRDVQVRILLDGIFHPFRGCDRDILYGLQAHPNIEVRFYEPLNLAKPWTWHNRLHDKHIIVDEKYAMIGGRNIGDKYFLKDFSGANVHDRDVVIINTDVNNTNTSVISDFQCYFQELWDHDYTTTRRQPSARHLACGQQKNEQLLNFIQQTRENRPDIFTPQDWKAVSFTAKKVTLINNPIQRGTKEPWVWAEMACLMEQSEQSILVQSPYFIPTRAMRKAFPGQLSDEEIVLLTNNVNSSPNYFGMAGYYKHRNRLMEMASTIYEYHGDGSIHAKSMVIDERLSIVGSFNVDSRSTFLSTETMVVIDSPEFTQHLLEAIKEITDQSVTASSHQDGESPHWFKSVIIMTMYVLFYHLDFLL
jgi:putative cardiolipin synthase